MIKMNLELTEAPKENALLIYKDGKLTPVNKEIFLNNVYDKINKLTERVKILENELRIIKGV